MIEEFVGSLVLDGAKGAAKKGIASGFAKLREEGRLTVMSAWRRNGRARISVSALLRIQRSDGRFAIIQNLHRPEDYSAIGGVIKCDPKTGPVELDKWEFIPENRMRGEDLTNDVRGYSRRKHVAKILKWSVDEKSAVEKGEECLRREITEELTQEFEIIPKRFPVNSLRFKFSHQYLKITETEQDLMPLTQAQLFRIYDLRPSEDAEKLFKHLTNHGGGEILWVTRNDILEGRCGDKNKPIGAPVELFIRNSIRRATWTPPNQRVN